MKYGSDNRKRGRAGQVQRQRRLKLFPVCAHCEAEGLVRATDVIDHKTSLAFGGDDTDENCQGLCNWHHAIKTALEDAAAGGGQSHPDWLSKPVNAALIVCGPPCSGKAAFAAEISKPGDVVVDLDAIAATIDPDWARTWTPDLLNKALRIRNAMLGEATRRALPGGGRLILVVPAPSPTERQWWAQRLGASIVLRSMPEAQAKADRKSVV